MKDCLAEPAGVALKSTPPVPILTVSSFIPPNTEKPPKSLMTDKSTVIVEVPLVVTPEGTDAASAILLLVPAAVIIRLFPLTDV